MIGFAKVVYSWPLQSVEFEAYALVRVAAGYCLQYPDPCSVSCIHLKFIETTH